MLAMSCASVGLRYRDVLSDLSNQAASSFLGSGFGLAIISSWCKVAVFSAAWEHTCGYHVKVVVVIRIRNGGQGFHARVSQPSCQNPGLSIPREYAVQVQ